MFYTYILISKRIDRYYIGFSENPEKRLIERHNRGAVRATKGGAPYKLMAKKSFITRAEAMAEEKRLKKMKSRKYVKWLLDEN